MKGRPYSLAALLGRTDLHSLSITNGALPSIGALPGIGLPADVLANRPDVRQAGLRLQSADWSVSAARADRLEDTPPVGVAAEEGRLDQQRVRDPPGRALGLGRVAGAGNLDVDQPGGKRGCPGDTQRL